MGNNQDQDQNQSNQDQDQDQNQGGTDQGSEQQQSSQQNNQQQSDSNGGRDREAAALRKEAANYRTQLRAKEKELEELKKSQMTEQERRDAEYKSAIAENAQLKAQQRLTDGILAAAKAGALNPEAVAKLALSNAVGDKVDADISDLVAGVKKEVPQLFGGGEQQKRTGSINGGSTSGKSGSPNKAPSANVLMGDWIRQQAGIPVSTD